MYKLEQHEIYTFVTVLPKKERKCDTGIILPKNASEYELAVVEVPSKRSSFAEGDVVIFHKQFSGAVPLKHEDLDKDYMYMRDENLIKVTLL